MVKKKDIIDQFYRDKQIAETGLHHQIRNTIMCHAFYNGHVSAFDIHTSEENREVSDPDLVQLSRIGRNVDAVGGFIKQNRRRAKYDARDVNDEVAGQAGKFINTLSGYIRDSGDASIYEDACTDDMLINGYGAEETDMSYIVGNSTTSQGGQIKFHHLEPTTYVWDPTAKDAGLIDARFFIYKKQLTLDDALALFPSSDEEDFERSDSSTDYDALHHSSSDGVAYTDYDDNFEYADKEMNLVNVYKYQWKEYEPFYRAPNPLYEVEDEETFNEIGSQFRELLKEQRENPKKIGTGGAEVVDRHSFNPEKKELTLTPKQYRTFRKAFPQYFKDSAVKLIREVYKTAVISGKTVFTTFDSVCQTSFSVKVKTGRYNLYKKRWEGMVNPMIEPTVFSAKTITEAIRIIASTAKGGYMIEEGAISNIDEFNRSVADHNANVIVAEGAITAGKIIPKAQPVLPNQLDFVLQAAESYLVSGSRIDEAFLGSKEGVESGIMFRKRVQQVMTTIVNYFAAETRFSKLHAEMMVPYLRVYAANNKGEILSLSNIDSEERFMELDDALMDFEYDIVIREAPESIEEKEQTSIVLRSLGDTYLSVGDATTGRKFHSESVKLMSLDQDVKQILIEALTPDEDVPPEVLQLTQQLEQAQGQIQALTSQFQQIEAAKTEAETQLIEAKRDRERVLAEKDVASIQKIAQEAIREGVETARISEAETVDVNI